MRTTDPQDELFDVLDARGNPTGEARPRWQVHRDGHWHRALHIWVGGVDARIGSFVLFQRRSLTKDTWPGALDVAVGGHVRAGDTLEQTVREAEEEIGLPVALADLVPIGRRFRHSRPGERERGVIDNELQEIYAVRSDLPPARYRLHPQEVSGLVTLRLDDALRLFQGHAASIQGAESGHVPGGRLVSVSVADFAGVPDGGDDGYSVRALTALRAVLAGERPEAFELRV
jgi:isopentenyldiphosphate isomerase